MKISEINPEDLNQTKLSLISFGSIAGIGIGLLFSFIITSTITKLVIAFFLISLSIYIIIKNIHLLLN